MDLCTEIILCYTKKILVLMGQTQPICEEKHSKLVFGHSTGNILNSYVYLPTDRLDLEMSKKTLSQTQRPNLQHCTHKRTLKPTHNPSASSIMQNSTSSCKPSEESRRDERMFSTRQ